MSESKGISSQLGKVRIFVALENQLQVEIPLFLKLFFKVCLHLGDRSQGAFEGTASFSPCLIKVRLFEKNSLLRDWHFGGSRDCRRARKEEEVLNATSGCGFMETTTLGAR